VILIDSSSYSTGFHDVLHSWDRYLIAYGGRGSGKTDTFYLKYLLSLFEPFHFKLAYINKEAASIKDHQYAGFKRVAKRIGVYDKLRFYDGTYHITNLANGNALIPRGMDDPEKTKGLDDITAIWWDEINKGTLEDFQALNALLRSPKAEYLQFAMSFNPVSDRHWLRSTFFSEADSHALNEIYKEVAYLHRSTYCDNDYINKDDYYETLLLSAAGNRNRIRVDVEGDWGLPENNNPWLYSFDESKHVKPTLPFLPAFTVYISFDFNRDPISCTAWQMSPHKGTRDSFIHCIREFGGKIQLRELCQRIKTTFPASILEVTGDSSGRKGDVAYNSAHDSAYSLIQAHLGLHKRQMKPNISNLLHENSRMLCNAMFHSYPNLYISEKGCPNLIADCQIAQVDDKSKKPHQLRKDRDQYKMDYFDGMRYYFQMYFQEFANSTYFKLKQK